MADPATPAGRVLMIGIDHPRLDAATADRVRRMAPGGAILFRGALDTPERLAGLMQQLRELLPAPTLVALDQEGGRVSRLQPWIGPSPTAAALAAAGGQSAYRFGRATGRALRSLGFNLDFAPVVDLCSADAPNGIGDRSFGTQATEVAALAGSFLDGLQGAGVAGCLKHFPGLGDTRVDSHVELPVCPRDRERLHSDDLVPYRLLGERAAAVMIGHAAYPGLEAGPPQPASLSPTIVERLLRGQLGYCGLVVSDDLEMGAVAPLDIDGAAAVAAVAAGCDLVPYCHDLDRAEAARHALTRAAADDEGFARRLGEAARAVTRTAARWPARRVDLAGWRRAAAGLRQVVERTHLA